ncbi:hypothetical protein E4U43_000997 [Claviceps pusilla]|uniref:Antigenic cell wall galactomannoprotein n=1 Tax=Claviceps pusilla TaxID=123648 RepID=A0A9P7NG87_9HYPO|nr:hypothetical protein E4U43_000997 [Claviceps pusilla]
MVSLKNVLLLATAAFASVAPRDGAKSLDDLHAINSGTVSLTIAINAYTGGLLGGFPILDAEAKLITVIKTATTNAISSGPATLAEAHNIINFITGTMEPTIKTSFAAIKSKKPLFEAAGLTSAVKSILESLKLATDNLGAALIAHVLVSVTADAKAIMVRIDADLDDVIRFYS